MTIKFVGDRPTRLFSSEHHAGPEMMIEVGAETPVSDFLDPDFWTHVASKMVRHQIIRVVSRDGTWFARVYVRSVSKLSAIVSLIEHVNFSDVETGAMNTEDFSIEWGGPKHQWRVMRAGHPEPYRKGFGSKGEAEAWLQNDLASAA